MTADTRRAARFLWRVLIMMSCTSMAGNITHAVLVAPADTVVLAAIAAVVAPAVLLVATHTVALMLRARAHSASYWCALTMTVALAVGAFVLSFDALRSLAITVGIAPRFAWLWPVIIDVSIAQATMALLSLHGSDRHQSVEPTREVMGLDSALGMQSLPVEEAVAVLEPVAVSDPGCGPVGVPVGASSPVSSTRSVPKQDQAMSAPPSPTPVLGVVGEERRWMGFAERLIADKRTRQPASVVARILALSEQGESCTQISSTLNVHHSTVVRIQQAIQDERPAAAAVH